MSKYFKKLNLQNTLSGDVERSITFNPIGDGNGVIVLDEETDPEKIACLDKYADERKCGVVRISPEIYEAMLKKKALMPSRPRLNPLNQIRVARNPNPFANRQNAVVVDEDKPAAKPKPKPDPGAEVPPPTLQQFRQRARRLTQIQGAK